MRGHKTEVRIDNLWKFIPNFISPSFRAAIAGVVACACSNCLAFGDQDPVCTIQIPRASFETDIRPILLRECKNCHTGYHSKDKYFAYDEAKANWEESQKTGDAGIGVQVERGSMPPANETALDPCDIERFKVWEESNFPP